MGNIQIVDKSNDRKYFSLIPNYIVNHSNHWEQSLYLVMKRIAGENGTCFTSQKTLAKLMGCSQQKVSMVVKLLEKRGWIRKTGRVIGKTKSINEYEIIDLWEINIAYYKKQDDKLPYSSELKTEIKTSYYGDSSLSEPKLPCGEELSYHPGGIEEEHIYKKNIIKKNIYDEIFNFYLEKSGNKERLTQEKLRLLKTRMKTFSVEDIKLAITHAYEDNFYSGNNDRGWKATFYWIMKNDEHVERLINLVPRKGTQQYGQYQNPNRAKPGKYAHIQD